MKHECIPLESHAAWRDALQGIPHAFAHTWENCQAMSLTTGYPTYLYCFENADARIVCPIAERSFGGYIDIVTPYGFSGFAGTTGCPDFPRHWRAFVMGRGYVCGYLAMNPAFQHPTYFDAAEAFHSNTLFYLDLTLPMNQMVSKLDRNRRRQLRDCHGTSLIFDKEALTPFLLQHYNEFMMRAQVAETGRFSLETLASLCTLPNVLMVGAVGDAGIESVNVFPYTPFLADSMINVPLPNGRRHETLLIWSAVEQLKAIGIPLLNLGGGIREGDTLAEYKRRFGARPVPFQCLKQVYRPDVYDILCRRSNANAHDRSGFFPAYRSPSGVNPDVH